MEELYARYPNLLSEMSKLKTIVVAKDERPNPSFVKFALPDLRKPFRAIVAFANLTVNLYKKR